MNSKKLLMTIMISITLNTSAGDLLAVKEGPFENYNRCSLSHGIGTIEIGHGFNFNITETSRVNNSLRDLEILATPAVAAASKESYRWFPTQTDYAVKNNNGRLVNFYSVGFKNIYNESNAAQELISLIDQTCNRELADFRILGEFQVDLRIGNKVFADKLIVKRTSSTYGPIIDGLYIVPNSFESKIENLNYNNGKFSFTIHVLEGDDDYHAIFEGSLSQNDILKGQAFILPNRIPLGSFTGKRI